MISIQNVPPENKLYKRFYELITPFRYLNRRQNSKKRYSWNRLEFPLSSRFFPLTKFSRSQYFHRFPNMNKTIFPEYLVVELILKVIKRVFCLLQLKISNLSNCKSFWNVFKHKNVLFLFFTFHFPRFSSDFFSKFQTSLKKLSQFRQSF